MKKHCDRSNTSFTDDINNILFRGNGPNITILEQCQPNKKDKNWWKKKLFSKNQPLNLDAATVFSSCDSTSNCDSTYDSRDCSSVDNNTISRCNFTYDSHECSHCDFTYDSHECSNADNNITSHCDSTYDSRDCSHDVSRYSRNCDYTQDQSRCSRITECDESRDDCSEISCESRSISCSFIPCVKELDCVENLPQIFVKDAVFGFPGDIINIVGKGFNKRGNPRILFDGIDGIDVEVIDCERIKVAIPYQIFGPIKFLQYVNKCDQSELQNISTCNAFIILQPNIVPTVTNFFPESVSISTAGFQITVFGTNFTAGTPVQVLLIGQYRNRAIVLRSTTVTIINDNELVANFNEIAIKNIQGFTFYVQVSVGKLVSPVGPTTFTFTP